jgi:indole-3-glycerol phosphate synthase
MTTALDRIIADKRVWVERCKAEVPLGAWEARARAASPRRGFYQALAARRAAGRYGLIAEVKKASPSRGVIRADFDPPSLAQAYERGGAACLSVLTDVPYFQGADSYLVAARAAVSLPVLRKDFMIDPYQIVEARALGADCILLILACLSDAQAAELETCAIELGMDVLVEVHDAAERDRALLLKSKMIGINNRNLKTLEVDLQTTFDLISELPEDVLVVAESGLKGPSDLARLDAAGVSTFLIGESLMLQPDVEAATRLLLAQAA